MAEGILRYLGKKDFLALSAGVKPGIIHPLSIMTMREIGMNIMSQRSKSVGEYKGWTMDYVITVCDNAKQSCPVFPAGTKMIHWNIEDPAEVEGSEEEKMIVFRRVRDELMSRISDLFNLPKNIAHFPESL